MFWGLLCSYLDMLATRFKLNMGKYLTEGLRFVLAPEVSLHYA